MFQRFFCTEIQRPHLIFAFFCLILCLLSSCNLFNPTNSSDISSNDADALIYQGQVLFRKGEYSNSMKYFSKAVKADSTKSEAWFGLAKASMYASGVNPFDIIKYIDIDGDSLPFMNLTSAEMEKYYTGISATVDPLRELVRRDTLTELYYTYLKNQKNAGDNASLKAFAATYGPDFKGFPLSDRKVRYSNFSASYAFLEFANLLLKFRYTNIDFPVSISLDANNNVVVNIDSLYNSAVNDSSVANQFNSSIDSLQSSLSIVTGTIIPTVTTLLSGTSLMDSITGSTDTSGVSEVVNDVVTDKVNSVDQTISFYKIGDKIDNDGDGCVDEEVLDGKDNDGDGFVDEDLRLVPLLRTNGNVADAGYSEIYYIGIGTDSLDHDGNGILENQEERSFIYQDTLERKTKNDYRLVFSKDFETGAASDSLKTYYRTTVMADTDSTNVKYSLAWRQKNIGGCWVNYSDEQFKAWFRNR